MNHVLVGRRAKVRARAKVTFKKGSSAVLEGKRRAMRGKRDTDTRPVDGLPSSYAVSVVSRRRQIRSIDPVRSPASLRRRRAAARADTCVPLARGRFHLITVPARRAFRAVKGN